MRIVGVPARLAALAFVYSALGVFAGPAAATPILPADAPPVLVAEQYLQEISELKTKPMAVGCATLPGEGSKSFHVLGAAFVKGNVMVLSNRYVCLPSARLWRSSPIFTGQSWTSVPFATIDALEAVAHEWFHTRGVASEEVAQCHAVQYAWKWLRRSALPAGFLAKARRFLLDNSRRPPGYKVPADCLLGG